VAKKTDKALKSLQKDVVKLQKQNDKLTKALEEMCEDQDEALQEVRDLLAERLTVRDTNSIEPAEADHSPDGKAEEELEITEAAQRRAKELGIPAENVLGEEGRGFYAIMRNFQNERIVIGAMAMGEAQAALDLTLDYVKTRKAFGAPLYEKQGIRQRLAMLAARVEAGRQLVRHAAWLDTQGVDATREVSMAKAYCGELVNEVVQGCQQFHGGMGYIRETAIERLWRDARILAIGGGATEVMLEEAAKRY